MASVAQVVYNYFINKGLGPDQAAGIAANAQAESSFSTTASGDGGSAIGIFQWEGSRRTALESFARRRGTSETDLQTQLDYAWHELNTNYSGVLHAIRTTSDPATVARYWDVGPGGTNSGSGFENSAGTTTQTRMSNAQQIAQGVSSQGANFLASYSGNAGSEGGGGNGGMGSAMTESTPKRADYSAIDGLRHVFQHVPELRNLLNEAVSTGMGIPEFTDKVENSKWWKSNSASARQTILLATNDPAEYKQQLGAGMRQISTEAGQLGVHLTTTQLDNMARAGLLSGSLSDKAWMDGEILGVVNPNSYKTTNGLSGQLAATVAQLQQLASDYGTESTIGGTVLAAKNILAGKTTIDTYVNHYKTVAKSMFPGLSSQIDSGLTVKDLAHPYQSVMGQLLEIDPTQIKTSDPLVKKALQGTAGVAPKGTTTPTSQPLWQFENTVRADPRWALTNNAKDTVSTALTKIGQDWGFM